MRQRRSENAIEANGLALFTDLYELTMLQAYVEEGMDREAVFSLFVRRLPERRNYLLACGLDDLLGYLERLQFSDSDLEYLASLDMFSAKFLDWLARFRFQGDLFAMPEGTPVFPNEPILEVVAPLPQAQLVETLVMNQIQLQTVLASKAARVAAAAGDKPVVDFGARRMHGLDAALKAARAFYIAGVAATSNVLAGERYGIPVSGTMAHSYIQAHDNEADAFHAFARIYPQTILLVDTYDTPAGVDKVIDLARELGDEFQVRGVRLDSGDLAELARDARRRLDAAGLHKVQVMVSGGLNEDEIQHLIDSGAPIDGFGVGTHMGVSSDAPDLDIAYKLAEYDGQGRLKLSTGKPVLPGRKQVFRVGEQNRDTHDIIGRAGEDLPGRPLLQPVMRGGRRLPDAPALQQSRDYAKAQIARLPETIQAVAPTQTAYPVELSDALQTFQTEVEDRVKHAAGMMPER